MAQKTADRYKYCQRCATRSLATTFQATAVRETKTGVLYLFGTDQLRDVVANSMTAQDIKHTKKPGHHLFIFSKPCDKIHDPEDIQ